MSAQKMLEQLLKSGLSGMDNSKSRNSRGDRSSDRYENADWGKSVSGTSAGGLLGMLLGSKRSRSMGGSALKVGSAAALGAAAFKAYTYWQSQQEPQKAPPASPARALHPEPGAGLKGEEVQSQAVLKAMIAAAKSDGHLDERERGLIHDELERIDADPPLRQWMEDELRKPLDPAEVASAASTHELGAEMYLASLLMADDTSFMERAYLDELARQLRLAPTLKAELERSIRPF
ncbi:tellurite resistance TerB family protein [Hydrogenophaga sp.]|jgi:uncharacterized membrane protein YebE (DUF533 family)|uniref:tellurite resistance TerB family protein n=1 Tax=Hydrogenophaga sp. TaxID=1904254 RepID=UPI00334D1D17